MFLLSQCSYFTCFFNKIYTFAIFFQLIVGILAFIIGVLALLLPETLGKPLPTTLEEAESLGSKPRKKNSSPGNKDARDGMELNQHEAKAWAFSLLGNQAMGGKELKNETNNLSMVYCSGGKLKKHKQKSYHQIIGAIVCFLWIFFFVANWPTIQYKMGPWGLSTLHLLLTYIGQCWNDKTVWMREF